MIETTYICEQCGEECEVMRREWFVTSEYWGLMKTTVFYELLSDCCGAEVTEGVALDDLEDAAEEIFALADKMKRQMKRRG